MANRYACSTSAAFALAACGWALAQTACGGGLASFDHAPFRIAEQTLIARRLSLPSTAVGRRTNGSAPTMTLSNQGYTHPSVVYAPGGWNGYRFWMAITPYFGPVGINSQYENPHIFQSDDGISWHEPNGLSNPIDLPPDAPSTAYWSDTHLVLGSDGYLYCFYRGSGNIGDGLGGRSIYYRRSLDGVTWGARTLVYSSRTQANLDATNLLASPAFVQDASESVVFDQVTAASSDAGMAIPAQRNQTKQFVFRRSGADLVSYGNYDPVSQIVNFTSRPWGPENDPWHLDAAKVGNFWFLLLNVGGIGTSSGSSLYLAASTDGWNFDVISRPLFSAGSYRSALVPISHSRRSLTFNLYQASTLDGSINLYRLRVIVGSDVIEPQR